MVVVKNLWFWGRQALRSRRVKVLSLESRHICTTLAVRAAWGPASWMGASCLSTCKYTVTPRAFCSQHLAVVDCCWSSTESPPWLMSLSLSLLLLLLAAARAALHWASWGGSFMYIVHSRMSWGCLLHWTLYTVEHYTLHSSVYLHWTLFTVEHCTVSAVQCTVQCTVRQYSTCCCPPI